MVRFPTALASGALILSGAGLLWAAPQAAADTPGSAECVISVTVKADAADAVPLNATTSVAPMRKEVTVAQGKCSGDSTAITAALAEAMLAANASRADLATNRLDMGLADPAGAVVGPAHSGLLDVGLPSVGPAGADLIAPWPAG